MQDQQDDAEAGAEVVAFLANAADWVEKLHARLAAEVAESRDNPPLFEDAGEEEPRVLSLYLRRTDAAAILDGLGKLAGHFRRDFGNAYRWLSDEVAEAEAHIEEDTPALLHLYVKTRQVERLLADLKVKAAGLRETKPLPASAA